MKVPDERLSGHVLFIKRYGEKAWSATDCLTHEEVNSVVSELMRARAALKKVGEGVIEDVLTNTFASERRDLVGRLQLAEAELAALRAQVRELG